jgi:hypothetical protein
MDSTVNKGLASLFAAYSTISEDEVALSNEWYHRWVVSDKYETNLCLSMDFLEQKMSDSSSKLMWCERCPEEAYTLNQFIVHKSHSNNAHCMEVLCKGGNVL